MRKSCRVSIVNGGLIVFVYDVGYAATIAKSGAAILEGYEPSVVSEAEFVKLGRQGMLLAYELSQDDDIELDVIVSAALTNKQRKDVDSFEATELAWLHSPTGHLQIDGYNTLRAGPDIAREQGGNLRVSPSHYSVCLYRSPGEGTDVLHLRPIRNKPTLSRVNWWPAADLPTAVASPPAPVIRNGVCETHARLLDEFQTALNIDGDTADKLALSPGDRLRVRIGDLEFCGSYMGADASEYREAQTRIQNRLQAGGAELQWVAGTDFDTTLLVCFHSDPFDTGTLPVNEWLQARVDPLH